MNALFTFAKAGQEPPIGAEVARGNLRGTLVKIIPAPGPGQVCAYKIRLTEKVGAAPFYRRTTLDKAQTKVIGYPGLAWRDARP